MNIIRMVLGMHWDTGMQYITREADMDHDEQRDYAECMADEIIRRGTTGDWDVWRGGELIAGPFRTSDSASRWLIAHPVTR